MVRRGVYLGAEAGEEDAQAHDAYSGEHDDLDVFGTRNERVDVYAPAPCKTRAYRAD